MINYWRNEGDRNWENPLDQMAYIPGRCISGYLSKFPGFSVRTDRKAVNITSLIKKEAEKISETIGQKSDGGEMLESISRNLVMGALERHNVIKLLIGFMEGHSNL